MSTAYQANVPIVAIDGELPAQTSITNGKALISNGSTASWQAITAMIGTNPGQVTPTAFATAVLPSQTGNSGKVLTTNGTTASWSSGAVGYTGSAGVAGATGYTGSAGVAGPAGATGYTGSAATIVPGGIGSLTYTTHTNMNNYGAPPPLPGTWTVVLGDIMRTTLEGQASYATLWQRTS